MRKGQVFPAPFAVYLDNDEYNRFEPDIFVVCDPKKVDEKGCHGAPDLVIEVISVSTQSRDYNLKSVKYRQAGVREYWVVNPLLNNTLVYVFDESLEVETAQYAFESEVTFALYPDLSVRVMDFI